MSMSERTVETHMRAIFNKLGLLDGEGAADHTGSVASVTGRTLLADDGQESTAAGAGTATLLTTCSWRSVCVRKDVHRWQFC